MLKMQYLINKLPKGEPLETIYSLSDLLKRSAESDMHLKLQLEVDILKTVNNEEVLTDIINIGSFFGTAIPENALLKDHDVGTIKNTLEIAMTGVYNELNQLGYNFKAEEIKVDVFKRVNSSANLYIGINEEKDLEL